MSDQDKEFEQWATMQGLIRNAFGITEAQTGIDIARSAWDARSARIAELEADVEKLLEALRANAISWPSGKAITVLDEYDKTKGL